MNSERDFWLQVRRGLSTVAHAADAERMHDPMWAEITRGLNIAVRAIERRWHMPRSSIRTIGQIEEQQLEPPSETLARSEEGIEQAHAIQ